MPKAPEKGEERPAAVATAAGVCSLKNKARDKKQWDREWGRTKFIQRRGLLVHFLQVQSSSSAGPEPKASPATAFNPRENKADPNAQIKGPESGRNSNMSHLLLQC